MVKKVSISEATEQMNSKKISLIGKIFIALLIVLSFIGCNYAYFNYIQSHAIMAQSYNLVYDENEISYTPFLDEGDCLEQTFRPGYAKISSILFRVRNAGEETDDTGILRITLSQDGNEIVQEEVAVSGLADGEYCIFPVGREVSTDKDCTIQILQEGASAQAYAIGVTASHAEGNVGNCEINGIPQEGELEVNYIYTYPNKSLLRNWILKDLLFILGIAVLIFANRQLMRFERIHKLLGILYWLLVPAVTFVAVELITGNLHTLGTDAIYKNIILYYLVYFALSLVFRKVSTVSFLYVLLFIVLALVQYFVNLFRGRPFMLTDIIAVKTAATVAGEYYFEIDPVMFYTLLFAIALLIVSQFFKEAFFKKKYYVRVICLAVSIGLLCGAKVRYGNILPPIYMWILNQNYQTHGLLVTLIGQAPYLSEEEPDGYSVEAVENIAKEFSQEQATGTMPENIILIMNESFSDLEYLSEIQTDTELLPFWKSLKENTIKGYLNVPVFGAGTSDSEYEVLTGNSKEFLVSGSSPYQMNVREDEIGMVSILEAQGYESVAMHPWPAGNWNRSKVYEYMGFDQFISEENWGSFEWIRTYPSDHCTYENLIEVYEGAERNLFVFLVTMQNHGGYGTAQGDFDVDVKLNYDTYYPKAEEYLSSIQESDKAYQELIEYFRKEDETTMIIMFGDHQASIENEFYEELFGKPIDELSFEEQQNRYVTPFMIWTNYDIEEQENVRMSANYFGSYILSLAGADLPAYNQFLLDAMEEIPIVGVGGICDRDGVWYDWNNIPEQYKEVIDNYKKLQYNNVFDRKHRVDAAFKLS